MELLTAFIGLVTAGFAAWTAYQSRPGRVLQPAGPGFIGPPVDQSWGGGPAGGWGPPPQNPGPNANPYPAQPPGGAYHGFGGPIGPAQQPAWDTAGPVPQHGWAPPSAASAAPVVTGSTRRYRVATAVRDAGIIFASSAIAGFVLGFVSPTLAGDPAVIVAVALVILLVGFAIAGVLAGRDRWRHLFMMALLTWVLNIVGVLAGTTDVPSWLLSVVVYPFIVGLAGAFATMVHRLRSAS